MTTDILKTIIEHKRVEIEQQTQAISRTQLAKQVENMPTEPPKSMRQALSQPKAGIIAEFKRRSPSKGWIHRDANPEEIIPQYELAGAAALSILTDTCFFGGSLNDIRLVRHLTSLPILRKDFIIDEYQIQQAKAAGADAILLIAACLTQEECRRLTDEAHRMKLEVLLEIHNEEEFAYIGPDTDMIGINNRHLGTFHTDARHSLLLIDKLQTHLTNMGVPASVRNDILRHRPPLVSESGLKDAETIMKLHQVGFSGFLMGEAFMKAEKPADELLHLQQEINRIHHENENY